MYYLILIISYVANGAALEVEHIPFDDKSSCQDALFKVLNTYDRSPTVADSMHVEGVCVARAEKK